MKTDPRPDLEALLVAGRRAAYGELHVAANNLGIAVNGDTFEQYEGGPISINGLDLRPMIDAVVIETAVRAPEVVKAKRPWQKFWAGYWSVMLDWRNWTIMILSVLLVSALK